MLERKVSKENGILLIVGNPCDIGPKRLLVKRNDPAIVGMFLLDSHISEYDILGGYLRATSKMFYFKQFSRKLAEQIVKRLNSKSLSKKASENAEKAYYAYRMYKECYA